LVLVGAAARLADDHEAVAAAMRAARSDEPWYHGRRLRAPTSMALVLVLLAAVVVAVVIAAVIAASRERGRRAVEALLAGDVPVVDVTAPVRDAAARCVEGERAAAGVAEQARALADEPPSPPGDAASLRQRVAWADEMLAELRRRADAWRGSSGVDTYADLQSSLRKLSEPADPHAGERESLAREMMELGLVGGGTSFAGRREYERLLGGQETAMRALARDLSAAVGSAVASHQRAFAAALEAPAPLEQYAPVQLAELQSSLRRATSRYAERLQSSSPGAEVRQRLAATAEDLATAEQQAGRHDLLSAVLSAAAAALPTTDGWDASREYRSACAAAATGLRELGDLQRARLERWRSRTLDELEACHLRIGEAAQAAIDTYLSRREQLWSELAAAADRVKLEAAREILAAGPDEDAILPVRGAAALCVIDEVAAGNLEHAARALVVDPPPVTDDASIEDDLRGLETLFERLERNSVAWAATNALLLQALPSDDSLAQSMLGLAAVPDHIALAGNDVLTYLHTGAPDDAALSVNEFASHAVHHVVPTGAPDATLPETLLEQMHHSVSGLLDFKGSLVTQLLAHSGPGGAITAYLKGEASHGAQFFLQQAGESPHIHDAAGHLLEAGQLTGSALHGLAGHVPVVTLVLSTVHEIRVRRDHDASVGESVANVAVDVFGVGTGIAAAAVAGGAIGVHGGPLILLTAPGAMAGKLVSNVVKKKRLEKATAEFVRVRDVYDGQFSTLVAVFSSSVRGTVAAQNTKYRGAVGEPPQLRDTAHSELDALVRSLRAATAHYAGRTGALLRAVQRALPPGHVESARQRLEATEAALARCDAELETGSSSAALSSLVDAPLPFVPAWQPSNEYRATCVASAEALGELSGRHREQVAAWAGRATERFERTKAAITTGVERAAQTCTEEIEAAAAPVEAAFAVVERERARLGLAPA
jgi:hypothetical protein